MALCCTVCGFWSPQVGPDRLDICDECLTLNFSATQPPQGPGAPRDPPPAPGAREGLEAFVDPAHPLTPRQVEAMARLAEAWRRQEEGEVC